jgi:phosphatidylinositol glycan class U
LASRSAQNGFKQWLQNRVEIATPLTSWTRVLEGLYLRNELGQASSYSGDLVHEIPLMLKFYHIALLIFTQAHISLFFILLDCLNGFLVYQVARKAIVHLIELEQFNKKRGLYAKLESESFLITHDNLNQSVWPLCALCVYLFNPFGLASCIGLSTVVVHNCALLLWLLFLLEGKNSLALAFLAVHANITVYSVILIVVRIQLYLFF